MRGQGPGMGIGPLGEPGASGGFFGQGPAAAFEGA
jgi:hypothetical protein